MEIKQLVPSLEMCKRAQKLGWERKTVFVWMQFPTYLDGRPTGKYVYHVEQHSSHPMYPLIPAPTLQEVLEELPLASSVFKAEASLELWCNLEERKIIEQTKQLRGTMTYAEKLSMTIIDNLANVKMTNQEKQWYLQGVLKGVMQAQREECINAAETVAHNVITEVIEQCEFDVSRFDVRRLVLQINEAIMEAEVKK